MFTVERRVGRLCEARIRRLTEGADVDAYSAAFRPMFTGMSRPVLCADHRPVLIYRPQVADALTALFQSLNSRWERVAILVAPTNATLAMQMMRIVRESANTSRNVFFDRAEAAQFLAPVLDDLERDRLGVFLDGR
jgi:hypothetical protein